MSLFPAMTEEEEKQDGESEFLVREGSETEERRGSETQERRGLETEESRTVNPEFAVEYMASMVRLGRMSMAEAQGYLYDDEDGLLRLVCMVGIRLEIWTYEEIEMDNAEGDVPFAERIR
jgi:hypothetical protein